MTIYNAIKWTLFACSILAVTNSMAIAFEPLHVRSTVGEELYAELKFSHAQPEQNLEISLADLSDLDRLSLPYQAYEHLKFNVIKEGNGRQGVILISSPLPMQRPEFNLLLKIKQGNSSYLQHLHSTLAYSTQRNSDAQTAPNLERPREQALMPQVIHSEQEIALSTAQYSVEDNQIRQLEAEYFTPQAFSPLAIKPNHTFHALLLQPSNPLKQSTLHPATRQTTMNKTKATSMNKTMTTTVNTTMPATVNTTMTAMIKTTRQAPQMQAQIDPKSDRNQAETQHR